jgi:hypothetical protein
VVKAVSEVAMTVTQTRKRPTQASRRAGYVIGVLVNLAMLYAINVWPGWEVLPFLTAEMTLVLGLVNASVLVNIAANVAYVVRDPAWFKALGDVVTITVGLLAMVRTWQVFPFDFGTSTFDWELLTRIALGVGMVGSGIGIVAALVRFARAMSAGVTHATPRGAAR